MATMASITIDKVNKHFGGNAVLKSLSLTIPDGSFFTLLGPSGCGKTTLLRCIAGFNEPDGGRILFDADDVTHAPSHKRDIGMVFQDYALFPDKTAHQNIAYGLEARGVARSEIRSRVEDALAKVGLADLGGRFPAQMSGGQRQRVALARALVIRPRVLLMDEPLSNLDAKMRIYMRNVILDLVREAKITTVFVTHDQEEALAMSDHIAVMDQGEVAQIGTPEGLYGTPANSYVADFIGSANVVPVAVEAKAEGGGILYRIGARRFEGVSGDGALNGSGHLIARPEELSLMLPSPLVPNALPGTVLRRQYLGFKTAYSVRLEDERELRVELHAGNMVAQFHPGDQVQVLVPASSRIVSA
jgi:iron(III) transport system ATP-binding protein